MLAIAAVSAQARVAAAHSPCFASGAMKPGKAAKRAARGERLKAALRENLKRRKAQVRGRELGVEPAKDSGLAAEAAPDGAPDFRRNRGRV